MTFSLFKRLLPNGRAWAIIAEKRLRQFFDGLSAGVSDPVVKEFDDRFNDLDPQLTTQLAQWEGQFALPNTGITEQERRDRLQAAWSAVGGQSPRYVQDTLQAAGFDVYLHEWWESGGAQQPAGDSFTNLGAQFGSSPVGVACSSDGGIVFVVDSNANALYRSTNSGDSFTNLGAMFGTAPNSVACSSDGGIVFVMEGNGDMLYRSTNSGDSFTNLGAMFGTGANAVACSADGAIVFVVDSSSNALYRSTNSGGLFTNLGAMFGTGTDDVACSADGDIVFVVDSNTDILFRSTNSGDSFTNLGTVFDTVPVGVACSADGAIVFGTSLDENALYRSTNSGGSSTNLGAQFSTSPFSVACSADGGVAFVVDRVSNSIYRSVGAVSPSVKGGIDGLPSPVVRNPFDYIIDAANPVKVIGAGHDLAYAGGDRAFANSQEASSAQGYLLVNKIAQSTSGFVGAGHDLAYAGGDSMYSGSAQTSTSMKQYAIPSDPTKYPYFLYIGGQAFPELANVAQSRRDEFEDLCLKICPAQQWLGILVNYN